MLKNLLILFLLLPVIVVGQYYPIPQTVTTGAPYCFRSGVSDKIQELPNDPGFFRAKQHGCVGDNSTDDTDSITALIHKAEAYYTSTGKRTVIYFAQGIYKTDFFSVNKAEILIRGKHKDLSVIKPYTSAMGGNSCSYKTIGITDISGNDFFLQDKSIRFDDVKFTMTNAFGPSSYFHNWGFYQSPRKIVYSRCNFVYDSMYIVLQSYWCGVDTFIVSNCTFHGIRATHPIRVDKADYFDISYNTVDNGVTGIFCGSWREDILHGGKITYNHVYGQSEEGISMDGFGNNTGLCPVICQGPVTQATNDGNGRIVVTNDFHFRQGIHPNDTTAPTDIASRSNWTNFYYSFVDSTLAGKYYKIYAFDTTHNTLTIDTIAPASIIPIGSTATVDAGFFDMEIAYNTVHDVWGQDSTYGTAFSLWLNNFNTNLHHNQVYNCANGLNSAGGLMLNLYILKSWRANIHDNTFTNCTGGYGINFNSFYTNDYKQYDNILKNNVFTNSTVVINNQVRFTNEGNTITP